MCGLRTAVPGANCCRMSLSSCMYASQKPTAYKQSQFLFECSLHVLWRMLFEVSPNSQISADAMCQDHKVCAADPPSANARLSGVSEMVPLISNLFPCRRAIISTFRNWNGMRHFEVTKVNVKDKHFGRSSITMTTVQWSS